MNHPKNSVAACLLAGLLAAMPIACGRGDGPALAEPAVRHPLAVVLRSVQDRMRPLDGADADGLDAFLRYAKPTASTYEVRRACELAGKALRNADPGVLADIVVRARDQLYDGFFQALDDGKLEALALRLSDREGPGEIERLRMEAIIRRGSAVYDGPLGRAIATIPFDEAVAPRALPLADLLPREDAGVEDWVGAAELLRLPEFVAEGDQRPMAIEVLRRGLAKWPDHPLLVASLVSVYVENEDRCSDDLGEFLKTAEKADPENAAWPYLRAARAFRVGKDAIALDALRAGRDRPALTFRGLERSRLASRCLEAHGYGPARARLTAYRSSSMASWFLLKDLANRAVARSYEYETSKRDDDLRLVLELPRRIDRQTRAAPRSLFAELLRTTMLATGSRRLSEYQRGRDPNLAREYADRARDAEEATRLLEEASQEYSGPDAWAKLYAGLGEDKFLTYLDGVLFGDEASFLLACRKQGSFAEAATLAIRPWTFEKPDDPGER